MNTTLVNSNIITGVFSNGNFRQPTVREANNFANRAVPWNGVGVDISNASCTDEAIAMAGLNWELGQSTVEVNGMVVPKYLATVRADTGKVLGITKDNYRPIQNADAFRFADSLIDQGCTFDKGGCYKGGELIWFLLKMPKVNICGDEHQMYMFLMNGNNGKSSLYAAFTTIRALCCNMAHLVAKNATYKVNIQHRGDVEGKMYEAREIMASASVYFDGAKHTMEELANIELPRMEMAKVIQFLLPDAPENASERTKETVVDKRNQLWNIIDNAPDLQNFGWNGLRLVNAITDYESHGIPKRMTSNFAENRLMNLATKPMMADRAVDYLREMAV